MPLQIDIPETSSWFSLLFHLVKAPFETKRRAPPYSRGLVSRFLQRLQQALIFEISRPLAVITLGFDPMLTDFGQCRLKHKLEIKGLKDIEDVPSDPPNPSKVRPENKVCMLNIGNLKLSQI